MNSKLFLHQSPSGALGTVLVTSTEPLLITALLPTPVLHIKQRKSHSLYPLVLLSSVALLAQIVSRPLLASP